jgi:hypothetical protein
MCLGVDNYVLKQHHQRAGRTEAKPLEQVLGKEDICFHFLPPQGLKRGEGSQKQKQYQNLSRFTVKGKKFSWGRRWSRKFCERMNGIGEKKERSIKTEEK